MHVDYNKVNACSAVKIFKNKSLEIFKHGKRESGAPALDPPLVTILARRWKIYPDSGIELSLLIQKSGFSRDQNLMYFVKKIYQSNK